MDHDTSKFTSHKVKPVGTPPSCLNGGLSELRRYTTLIYYISTCNNCSGAGDGIPTLKVVELTPATSVCAADAATACGTMTSRTVAEGIENMQIEYGIDSPLQDGTPDTYSVDPVAAADWKKVVAAKIFLLARNTETTPGYINDRIYSLKSGVPDPGGTPFNDNYKRHVYSSTTMATNIAGRRLP
jgi:type IV pilus assembly protein PilW